MVETNSNSSQEKLEAFVQLLESSRQLQQDILTRGLDAAYLYVEDVEGDWLENWGEDDLGCIPILKKTKNLPIFGNGELGMGNWQEKPFYKIEMLP